MSESPLREADSSTDTEDNSSSVEWVCGNCGNEFTTQAGYKKHIREICTSEGHKCPTCGLQHPTERGVWAHHSQVHNEKLHIDKECPYCGDSFSVEPHREDTAKYCSPYCGAKDNAQTGARVDRVELTCKWCESDYEVLPHRADSIYCSKECRNEHLSESMRGEGNHAWKGGQRKIGYGRNWDRQREKARKRDNYRCQGCGVDQSDYWRKLSVHHIKHRSKFVENGELNAEQANRLKNLVTLCIECHRKWETVGLRPKLID